jgi:hypothetical protein
MAPPMTNRFPFGEHVRACRDMRTIAESLDAHCRFLFR